MSELTTLEVVVTSDGDTDDELVHYYCECNPDIALCGWDLTDREETDDEAGCVVCADLEAAEAPCFSPTCPYRRDHSWP